MRASTLSWLLLVSRPPASPSAASGLPCSTHARALASSAASFEPS